MQLSQALLEAGDIIQESTQARHRHLAVQKNHEEAKETQGESKRRAAGTTRARAAAPTALPPVAAMSHESSPELPRRAVDKVLGNLQHLPNAWPLMRFDLMLHKSGSFYAIWRRFLTAFLKMEIEVVTTCYNCSKNHGKSSSSLVLACAFPSWVVLVTWCRFCPSHQHSRRSCPDTRQPDSRKGVHPTKKIAKNPQFLTFFFWRFSLIFPLEKTAVWGKTNCEHSFQDSFGTPKTQKPTSFWHSTLVFPERGAPDQKKSQKTLSFWHSTAGFPERGAPDQKKSQKSQKTLSFWHSTRTFPERGCTGHVFRDYWVALNWKRKEKQERERERGKMMMMVMMMRWWWDDDDDEMMMRWWWW